MFAIYKLEVAGDAREYVFSRKIQKGDRTVPRVLCELIDDEASQRRPLENDGMSWESTGERLLGEVLKEEEKREERRYKLIIDAMPNKIGPEKETQLFEICHIWGYSDRGWTPLLLRLHRVFEGTRETLEQTRFPDEIGWQPATESVYEFLYLRWGNKSAMKTPEERRRSGEARNWGRVGFTNGTLLWPPHLEHLLSKIGFKRSS